MQGNYLVTTQSITECEHQVTITAAGRRAVNKVRIGLKHRVRSSLHPAQILSIQRALAGRTPDLGLLSVIIPAYNVELYLADCLNSVLSQSYPYLQVVIIDDGSTDTTLSIARQYAHWDKRIRIIELEHGGNGRARNIGIAAATGQYLAFADSDDVVAKDAYMDMVSVLHRTRSDFVVGSSNRIIGSKRVATKLSESLHKEIRLSTRLADFPGIIDDVFLWNKVFRREFWDQMVGPIPEGVLYEDQETTARAFVRAAKFDVLKQIVYGWRQRPDGSSITQSRADITNLLDRLEVARQVSRLLLDEGSDGAVQVWIKRLFGRDLLPYFDLVESRGDEYWQTLRDGVTGLLKVFRERGVVLDETWQSVDPHARVYLMLAEQDALDDVKKVIVDRIDYGTGYEIHVEGDGFIATPNYWSHLENGVEQSGLRCSEESLTFESEIRLRDLQDGRGPVLRGHAFVRGLESRVESSTLLVDLGFSDGTVQRVTALRLNDERIDIEAHDAFASHSSSAFEIDLRENPELISTVNAKIVLKIGSTVWAAQHQLGIAESLALIAAGPVGEDPLVTGFSADYENESFAIDIKCGSRGRPDEIFLETSQNRITPSKIAEFGTHQYRLSFMMNNLRWGRQVYAHPSGAYTLRYKDGENSQTRAIGVSPDFSVQTPQDFNLLHANLTAWVSKFKAFAITIRPPRNLFERSKYGQRELRRSFSLQSGLEIQPHVVFESFGGKVCTGNPRAVADALHSLANDVKIYFSIRDFSVPYPHYAVPLVRGTEQWNTVIQTASLLVNNSNFPFYFKKNDKQFYLQTWHGTPLKRIGLDAPKKYLSASYRSVMGREAEMWDLLLAQNSESAQILPIAFGYTGPVLGRGYPRNDALVTDDTQTHRADVRKMLGIGGDQVAILYAPTWRDNSLRNDGTRAPSALLDFQLSANKLGNKFVFLRREHHNVSVTSAEASDEYCIDVSSHPEINDLILASDALVTDYSSIVFDYMMAGKPVFLYTPDQLHYESNIRGFYKETKALLPSKSFQGSDDLLEALLQVKVGNLPNCSRIVAPTDDKLNERVSDIVVRHLLQHVR